MKRWLILAILLLPTVASDVQFSGTVQLAQDVATTRESTTVTYFVGFESDETTTAYLQPIALPASPSGESWKTSVYEEGRRLGSATEENIELGHVKADAPRQLEIRITAPAGNLAEPTTFDFRYALAVRSTESAQGNGGTMDPALTIHATMHAIGDSVPPSKFDWGTLAWILGVIPIIGLVFALKRFALRPTQTVTDE